MQADVDKLIEHLRDQARPHRIICGNLNFAKTNWVKVTAHDEAVIPMYAHNASPFERNAVAALVEAGYHQVNTHPNDHGKYLDVLSTTIPTKVCPINAALEHDIVAKSHHHNPNTFAMTNIKLVNRVNKGELAAGSTPTSCSLPSYYELYLRAWTSPEKK